MENDALKTREVKFKFDIDTKLDDMKKFVLRSYAVEFLKYKDEIDSNKFYRIDSYFWANSWTIRVDVTRKILGFKHTKHYLFSLDTNNVEQIVPDGEPNDYAYTVKKYVSNPNSYRPQVTFLEFVSRELKDQTKDFNITEEVREYNIIPGIM